MHVIKQLQTLNPDGMEYQVDEKKMKATDAVCSAFLQADKLLHTVALLLSRAEGREMFDPLLLFLCKVGREIAQQRLVHFDSENMIFSLLRLCNHAADEIQNLLSKVKLLVIKQSTVTETFTRKICEVVDAEIGLNLRCSRAALYPAEEAMCCMLMPVY